MCSILQFKERTLRAKAQFPQRISPAQFVYAAPKPTEKSAPSSTPGQGPCPPTQPDQELYDHRSHQRLGTHGRSPAEKSPLPEMLDSDLADLSLREPAF
jgi:hypothetical protein